MKVQKHIYWLICTVILAIIVLYGMRMEKVPLPRFRVSDNVGTQEISIYEAEPNRFYVFLPSYAELDTLSVIKTFGQQVSLGGVKLSNGMTCGDFVLDTEYPFEINGHYEGTLCFYQSANVATMYIDTASGGMEYIHNDKEYEEYASVTLYTDEGDVNYHDDAITIKGRGNASWWLYDKRPYSLKLSSDADLLDMGAATNWILLANATDETNLNNYLVYDLASRVGLSWAPECRYVDIYLNEEYSGLYLLAEKVEVGTNRLDINANTGNFLCKFDLYDRWSVLRSPFLTNAERTVEISYPKILQETEYNKIINQVNQMENAILSGVDLSTDEIIDLDSWVRRYLIDEISGNIDSDLASSYFYYSDGKFYAGPVWDYDNSFGNMFRNQEANAFIAKNANKSATLESPYYSALYENKSFYNRMIEIYSSEFLPLLEQMIDNEINSHSLHISQASKMNSMRWRTMYDMVQSQSPESVCNSADLIDYLERRITFLNHAWLDNTDYCTIQFEIGPYGEYWNISIPRGSLLDTSYVDLESTTWIDVVTEEVYDFSQPIMTDLLLKQQLLQEPVSDETITENIQSEHTFVIRDYITFLNIVLFGLLMLSFVYINFKHRN